MSMMHFPMPRFTDRYRLHELVGGPAAGSDAPQDWGVRQVKINTTPTCVYIGELDSKPDYTATVFDPETYSVKTWGGPFGQVSYYGHDQSSPEELEAALWAVLMEAAGCTRV